MREQSTDQNVIRFRSAEGWIEEIAGCRKFRIPFIKGEIPVFQKTILEGGFCRGLLPMRFVSVEGFDWIYYDFSGFVGFWDMVPQWEKQDNSIASEIMRTLSSVVCYLLSGENYLLPVEGFGFDANTIFINPSTGEVRVAYIPEAPRSVSVQQCMVDLIGEIMKEVKDDQWESYGEELRQKILSCNLSLAGIQKILNEQLRQMHVRKWPAGQFERASAFQETGLKEVPEEVPEEKLHAIKMFSPFRRGK